MNSAAASSGEISPVKSKFQSLIDGLSIPLEDDAVLLGDANLHSAVQIENSNHLQTSEKRQRIITSPDQNQTIEPIQLPPLPQLPNDDNRLKSIATGPSQKPSVRWRNSSETNPYASYPRPSKIKNMVLTGERRRWGNLKLLQDHVAPWKGVHIEERRLEDHEVEDFDRIQKLIEQGYVFAAPGSVRLKQNSTSIAEVENKVGSDPIHKWGQLKLIQPSMPPWKKVDLFKKMDEDAQEAKTVQEENEQIFQEYKRQLYLTSILPNAAPIFPDPPKSTFSNINYKYFSKTSKKSFKTAVLYPRSKPKTNMSSTLATAKTNSTDANTTSKDKDKTKTSLVRSNNPGTRIKSLDERIKELDKEISKTNPVPTEDSENVEITDDNTEETTEVLVEVKDIPDEEVLEENNDQDEEEVIPDVETGKQERPSTYVVKTSTNTTARNILSIKPRTLRRRRRVNSSDLDPYPSPYKVKDILNTLWQNKSFNAEESPKHNPDFQANTLDNFNPIIARLIKAMYGDEFLSYNEKLLLRFAEDRDLLNSKKIKEGELLSPLDKQARRYFRPTSDSPSSTDSPIQMPSKTETEIITAHPHTPPKLSQEIVTRILEEIENARRISLTAQSRPGVNIDDDLKNQLSQIFNDHFDYFITNSKEMDDCSEDLEGNNKQKTSGEFEDNIEMTISELRTLKNTEDENEQTQSHSEEESNEVDEEEVQDDQDADDSEDMDGSWDSYRATGQRSLGGATTDLELGTLSFDDDNSDKLSIVSVELHHHHQDKKIHSDSESEEEQEADEMELNSRQSWHSELLDFCNTPCPTPCNVMSEISVNSVFVNVRSSCQQAKDDGEEYEKEGDEMGSYRIQDYFFRANNLKMKHMQYPKFRFPSAPSDVRMEFTDSLNDIRIHKTPAKTATLLLRRGCKSFIF